MKLYTTYIDYFATGEGRTVFLNITYATSEENAIQKMKDHIGGQYGEYFILGVEVEEGFNPKNPYIKELLSKNLIKKIKADNAMIDIFIEQHFNYL